MNNDIIISAAEKLAQGHVVDAYSDLGEIWEEQISNFIETEYSLEGEVDVASVKVLCTETLDELPMFVDKIIDHLSDKLPEEELSRLVDELLLMFRNNLDYDIEKVMEDLRDQQEYNADPYRYYGVKRSDFF